MAIEKSKCIQNIFYAGLGKKNIKMGGNLLLLPFFFLNENSHIGRMDFRSKALITQKSHLNAADTSGLYSAKRAFLLHKCALQHLLLLT